MPRRREGREDAFREWVETLGTPSAVASLRQWPSSTGTAQTELLHAVERVAARLRTDPLRRLLTAYAEPRWPAVALDRYRLHERGVALPVARAHAATDVLAVSNPGDRPVLVALVPPTVPRVAVLATPSAFRLEPKASRSVRLTFIAKGSGDNNKVETEEEEAQLPTDTYFLEVFCCTVTQGKDRKTLAPTRVDGYPAVVPLCFEYTAGDQGSTLPVYASAGALGQAVCAGGSAAVAGLGSVALVTVGDTAYCRKGWCLEGGDVAGAAEAAEAEAQRLAGLEWPGLLLPAFVVLPTDAAHGGLYYPYAALTEAAREGTLRAAGEREREGRPETGEHGAARQDGPGRRGGARVRARVRAGARRGRAGQRARGHVRAGARGARRDSTAARAPPRQLARRVLDARSTGAVLYCTRAL